MVTNAFENEPEVNCVHMGEEIQRFASVYYSTILDETVVAFLTIADTMRPANAVISFPR